MTFVERIKALRSEVEALKAVRRKSSLSLNTITKTATCTATLYKTSAGVIVCRYAGLVEIVPNSTDNEAIFCYAQPAASQRNNRQITLTNWVKSDGTLGVLCTPFAISGDGSMASESTKNVTITVYITSTSDFTTSSSQVRSY